MNAMEVYSYLFFDSVLAELIFPLQTQLVFPAMLAFGGYNLFLAFVLTLAASLLGAMGNWYIGRLIALAKQWYGLAEPEAHSRVGRTATFCQRWGKWLMVACGLIPVLGSVMTMVLGFFRVRFIYLLLAFLPAKALLLVFYML